MRPRPATPSPKEGYYIPSSVEFFADFAQDATTVCTAVFEWFDACLCHGLFSVSDRAANCEVFVCARSEKSDGGGDAMGDEFEGSPPADEHAEVKPFGVAESDGSVAGHARDEVDHAEKRRRDPPSVSASSCDVQGRCFGDTAVKS